MNTSFLYKKEYSFIGTEESAVCGLNAHGRKIAFTGDYSQLEDFGITAEELAAFASNADSVHFQSERVLIPVCGAGLNETHQTQEIAVLTVRAIANSEVVNAAQISRVVCVF